MVVLKRLSFLAAIALGGCSVEPKPEFSRTLAPHAAGQAFSLDQVRAMLDEGLAGISGELELAPPLTVDLAVSGDALTVRGHDRVVEIRLPFDDVHEVVLQKVMLLTLHEATEMVLGSGDWLGGHLYTKSDRLRWVGDGTAEVLSYRIGLRVLWERAEFRMGVTLPPRDGSLDLSQWLMKVRGERASMDDTAVSYHYAAARQLMTRWEVAARERGMGKPFAELHRFTKEPRSYDEVVGWLEQTSGLPMGEMTKHVDLAEVHTFLEGSH